MTWYVHRRQDGTIASAHQEMQPGYAVEALPDNAPEVIAFFTLPPQAVAMQQLQQNDALMFRALEVLVDVLISKGTITGTDFPLALRTLYQNRKALRNTAGVP